MKFNPKIHHRQSIRLKEYDYSSNGVYFVTICTHEKSNLFGEIVGAGSKPALDFTKLDQTFDPKKLVQMDLNVFGKIVEETWIDLLNHNSNIELDTFIVMPNHIHGILLLCNKADLETRPGLEPRAGLEPAPTARTLSEIVRQFKTFSARRINKLRLTQGQPIWQRNYYEHIIRDEHELYEIQNYIIANPLRWLEKAKNDSEKE